MVEKVYNFTLTDEKVIERIICDDLLDFNHVVLLSGDALPLHHANSNAYLAIVRGVVTTAFNDGEPTAYPAGSIVNVPFRTKMNVSNQHEGILEFFIVKTPSTKK